MSAAPSAQLSRFLVVLLTLWGCAVIAPEYRRVFNEYGTLGFFADNDGRISVLSQEGNVASVLHDDDCIDLRKTPLADRLAVFGGMGGMTYVRPDLVAHLTIVRAPCAPDAPREVVELHAEKPPFPVNRSVLFINQTLGLLFIALAAVLVWQRPSPMTWGFFLYAIWFNPGQFFVFYAELQRWPRVLLFQEFLQAIAQGVGYAGFVLFALRFPHDTVSPRWQRFEQIALPTVAVAIVGLTLLGFGASLGYESEIFSRWSYGAGYLVDIGVLFILRFRRREQPPEDEQRTRWVHWGCRVGLAAFIFADSNMATSWWEPVWAPFCKSGSPVASLVCDPTTHLLSETTLLCVFLLDALIAVAVFHAVRRHRVVNVSFAVSRGTTLVLTWIIIAAGFTALTILVEEMGVLPSREDKFVWYFAALLVIKITFEWLHEKLNDLCDHLFFHRLHRAEHRFGEVRERLAEARDLDEVDGRMIREPYACLDLASAAVFRRDAGDVFRPHIPPAGWDSTRPGAALPAGEVEHLLDGARGPVRLDARARILALPGGTAQPVIAAPVLGNVGLAAVALYGAHRTGDDLSNEEFALLRDLAAAASFAYRRTEALALRAEVAELRRVIDALPYGTDPEDQEGADDATTPRG